MDLGLGGRNCVVIGGSRGIGRSIALGLAAEGANVAICARNEEPLRAAESEISDRGVQAYAHSCDAADPGALRSFLDDARSELGSVDVLVHNASALAVGPDLSDWEASLQVDLMAGVHAAEHVIPWMKEAGGGSILFVASTSGLEADPGPSFSSLPGRRGSPGSACQSTGPSIEVCADGATTYMEGAVEAGKGSRCILSPNRGHL